MIKVNQPEAVGAPKQKPVLSFPNLFKNFAGTEDDKTRSLIHLESLLEQEKIKNQENQVIYHKNEKAYLAKISKLESEINEWIRKDAINKKDSNKGSKVRLFMSFFYFCYQFINLSTEKLESLTQLFNAAKAENLILKEEKDDMKAGFLEEIDKLKEDLAKKSRNIENLREDLMKTKDEKMRFETSLRNKDAELSRLQTQLGNFIILNI